MHLLDRKIMKSMQVRQALWDQQVQQAFWDQLGATPTRIMPL